MSVGVSAAIITTFSIAFKHCRVFKLVKMFISGIILDK